MLEIGIWLSHLTFPISIPASAAAAAVAFLGQLAANYAISCPDSERHRSVKLMSLASPVACTQCTVWLWAMLCAACLDFGSLFTHAAIVCKNLDIAENRPWVSAVPVIMITRGAMLWQRFQDWANVAIRAHMLCPFCTCSRYLNPVQHLFSVFESKTRNVDIYWPVDIYSTWAPEQDLDIHQEKREYLYTQH